MNERPVSISLCCNNPDNGMFAGRVSRLEIGDNLLELENTAGRDPSLRYDFKTEGSNGFAAARAVGSVKISRCNFPIIGYKYGWGNWCWDLVLVSPEVAVDVINYCRHLNIFSAEGDVQFVERFEALDFNKQDPKAWWFKRLRREGYQRP